MRVMHYKTIGQTSFTVGVSGVFICLLGYGLAVLRHENSIIGQKKKTIWVELLILSR